MVLVWGLHIARIIPRQKGNEIRASDAPRMQPCWSGVDSRQQACGNTRVIPLKLLCLYHCFYQSQDGRGIEIGSYCIETFRAQRHATSRLFQAPSDWSSPTDLGYSRLPNLDSVTNRISARLFMSYGLEKPRYLVTSIGSSIARWEPHSLLL